METWGNMEYGLKITNVHLSKIDLATMRWLLDIFPLCI